PIGRDVPRDIRAPTVAPLASCRVPTVRPARPVRPDRRAGPSGAPRMSGDRSRGRPGPTGRRGMIHCRRRSARRAPKGYPPVPHEVDQSFLALPLRPLADAALARARSLGAAHADFRLERVRSASWRLRDARPAGTSDTTDLGYAVRVVHGGTWGFASGVDLTPEAAAKVASQAVAMAKRSARVSRAAGADAGGPAGQWGTVELADEPVHAEKTWVSSYEVDPFAVPDEEKAGLLAEWSARLLAANGVDHVDASLLTVHENKFYADTAGSVTTQQRVRLHPSFTAVSVDESSGEFDSMRTLAP